MKSEFWVDFNFEIINGKRACQNIKTGFRSKLEAEEWAKRNTTDGEVNEFRLIEEEA